ncbi:MAG: metallophosphoesterase [Candidatus Odinarchaeia archaeon]
MRLLILSDIHGNIDVTKHFYKFSEEIDLVVICGDLTHFGSIELAEDILKPLLNLGTVLFVPGNCDARSLSEWSIPGVVNLHGSAYVHHDYSFIGVGGSNPTPFDTMFELSEIDIEILLRAGLKKLTEISNEFSKLFLVTHTPPYGCKLDLSKRGVHAGSRAIRKFIEEYSPVIALAGHIHEGRGVDKIGETLVLNPGMSANGYYAILHIEEDGEITYELRNIFEER